MKTQTLSFLASAAIAVFLLSGCGLESGNSTGPGPVTSAPPDTVPDEDGHDHAHPTEGLHHGELIELSNEEYYAELLYPQHSGEGREEAVTIFILNESAKAVVPIEAGEVTINVRHDDKGKQFKLAALPTDDDPAGKSSRFVSSDKELLGHLHEEEIEGALVVTINGKSCRGQIAHHHHDGHDHNETKRGSEN